MFHNIVHTEKAAEQLFKAFEARDKEAIESINKHYSLLQKAVEGEMLPDGVLHSQGFKREDMFKSSSTAIRPVVAEIDGINNLTSPLRIDTKYVDFYQMVPGAMNSTEVRIYDFENTLTHKEYPLGKDIESQPFGTEEVSRLGIRRFGGGSFVLRMLMNGQARYTISNILRGHQIAEMKMRSNWAYAQIDAAADAAIIAGQVTSFSTNIITSINNAYASHVEFLDGLGYQITDDVPMLLLLHGSHRPAVNAAYRTIAGENGNNILLEYPVQPVYTWNSNILKQYDGANAGILILPGVKNVWANFDGPRVDQERAPRNDGIDLVYQYHYNSQMETDQVRVVKIA